MQKDYSPAEGALVFAFHKSPWHREVYRFVMKLLWVALTLSAGLCVILEVFLLTVIIGLKALTYQTKGKIQKLHILLKLFQRDSKEFPSQLRNVISPASPESSRWGWDSLEDIWKAWWPDVQTLALFLPLGKIFASKCNIFLLAYMFLSIFCDFKFYSHGFDYYQTFQICAVQVFTCYSTSFPIKCTSFCAF